MAIDLLDYDALEDATTEVADMPYSAVLRLRFAEPEGEPTVVRPVRASEEDTVVVAAPESARAGAVRPARTGFGSMALAFGAASLCIALTYLVPGLAGVRPWVPGEPLPVIAALWPTGETRVVETERGELIDVAPMPAEIVEPASVAEVLANAEPTVPVTTTATYIDEAPRSPRTIGVPTALEDPGHRGMAPFYAALHRAATGEGIARASQWGDSTIAADGITSTVRRRLQARFGDGGPGFVSAGMDPRWNLRKDVANSRTGDWTTLTILNGGANGRYGFGGIVSTASSGDDLVLHAPKTSDRPVELHHLEVWYQQGPGRGEWWARVDGDAIGGGSARAEATSDGYFAVDIPDGFTTVAFGATGGSVPFYGVILETDGPGVVWDALGVVGVGTKSFTKQSNAHLADQVAHRDLDLVVVMLGGNELGWPILAHNDGRGWDDPFRDTVRRVRAGAPDAGCLIITPLDQGTRDLGRPQTKPNLPRMIASQRRVAAEEGCALWSAYDAMGGTGSMVRWTGTRPPLAWTDLLHLSGAGQEIVGNLLADAILAGYDDWVANGGTSAAR